MMMDVVVVVDPCLFVCCGGSPPGRIGAKRPALASDFGRLPLWKRNSLDGLFETASRRSNESKEAGSAGDCALASCNLSSRIKSPWRMSTSYLYSPESRPHWAIF